MDKELIKLKRELNQELRLKRKLQRESHIISERKRVAKDIFKLKNPGIEKIKTNISNAGNIIRTHVQAHNKVYKQSLNQSSPRTKTKTKTVYVRKLIKGKKGYYRPKYVAKKIKVPNKSKSNGTAYDPLGLSYVYRVPHY